MKYIYLNSLYLLIAFFLIGCLEKSDDNSDEPMPIMPIDNSIIADTFLQFNNNHAPLSAGVYTIAAATVIAGESDDYVLTITFDDGQTETINGRWENSVGLLAMDENNGQHQVELIKAGGLKVELSSSVDNYLFITRNGHVIAENNDDGDQTNALITLQSSQVNSAVYAQAYYKAVDPFDERTTLADWKNTNEFTSGADQHIVFRDEFDLGYGRDIYAKVRTDGGFSFYVDNYVVQLSPGDVSTYANLSIDAAIAADTEYHIGSNAIEFSPIDSNDANSDRIVKMFTFAPKDNSGIQQRTLSIDMDGRGEKFMPTVCLVCHGGILYPLNEDGSFPEQSLISGKFNILNPEHFAFKDIDGLSKSAQQPAIKVMNQLIHQSFSQMNARNQAELGHWNGEFAMSLGTIPYSADFSEEVYNQTAIPQGWLQNINRPDGVQRLYQEVIKPHCIACHSLRGNNAGENVLSLVNGDEVALANAINFSSYEKFISYNDEIIKLVYQQGRMPASLLNFQRFWKNPDAAPTLLASFLNNFDAFDNDGAISVPKKPVAVIALKRSSASPVTLNASASYLANNFQWTIINSPLESNASLSVNTGETTVLSGDIDGEYQIELIASNSNGLQDNKLVTITLDSQLYSSTEQLTFANDIEPILGENCTGCHASESSYVGIPVYFTTSSENLYKNVLARINLHDPENSLLLIKATRKQHGGGIIFDRDIAANERDYQTLLNWIALGAPCGENLLVCSQTLP